MYILPDALMSGYNFITLLDIFVFSYISMLMFLGHWYLVAIMY